MGFGCSRCSPLLILLAAAHRIPPSCDSHRGHAHLAKAGVEGSNPFPALDPVTAQRSVITNSIFDG